MMDLPPKHPWLGLITAVILCFAMAGVGGWVTTPSIPGWYAGLVKPSWTPPDWVFGPVWSVLYLGMAVAVWLVWRQNDFAGATVPMVFFGVQLALNGAWSWIFFGLHSPGAALVDLVLLWTAIAATTVTFWRRSIPAAILLVPYLVWVSFAGALNFAVWRLNG
jgi:tryptophan-rich sensory protein